MATVTKTFRPVLGKRIRVTVLDEDGSYLAPGTEDANLVTDGFVSVNLSAQVEEGEEIIQKKADGTMCINEMQPSAFKRLNVEIVLCGVNPYLLSMISNADVYYDHNGAVAGFTMSEGSITKNFAFELWTGLSGDRSASGYLLLPLVNGGTLGDLEITGEDAINFTITGAYTKGGNAWGFGPYEVVEDAGTDEVQTITISGSPTGGDFRLRFGGRNTAPISYDSTAQQVQDALEALSSIPAGSVVCAGGPLPDTPVTVTFVGALASEDVPLLTARNVALTGGTDPAIAIAETTPGADGSPATLASELDPLDHLLVLVTEVTPPPSDDSPQPMPT